MTGTVKLKPLIIGKSKKLKAFKNFDYENYVIYFLNKKTLMNYEFFFNFY